MMTGQQYKKSLDDNRETYFEGERVRDIVNHPLLGECVSRIAEGYDKFYSPEPGAVSPLMKIPRSANELRDRIPLLLESDIVANVTYQSIMTLTTAATRIADALPEYAERIRNYVQAAQRKDIRIVECITDAKGDRVASARQAGRSRRLHARGRAARRRRRDSRRQTAHHRRVDGA